MDYDPHFKEKRKDKRSCNRVKGEREQMGGGGPHEGLPKYVWGSLGNMNLEMVGPFWKCLEQEFGNGPTISKFMFPRPPQTYFGRPWCGSPPSISSLSPLTRSQDYLSFRFSLKWGSQSTIAHTASYLDFLRYSSNHPIPDS